MTGYERFRGKRLAIVESMLHDAFYSGIHRARDFGCEIWLLVQGEEWYTGGRRPLSEHPLGRVDRVLHVDTHDWRAVLEALTDENGKALVDGILSFSDYHTEVTARAAESLGLPTQGMDAVRSANDKHLLRAALDGDPANVRWRLVTCADELDEAIAHVGLPLIAKPPSEAISYGVRKCSTAAEAEEAWRELSGVRRSLRGQPRPGHVLVEEYVEGTEVSVESMTVDGNTHFFGATSKHLHRQTMLEEAHSFPVALDPDVWEAVRSSVERALRAISYRQGPAHTEVMITGDGPRVIEVNPRLPAHMISTMVTDVCGTNPHLDAKLLALGVGHVPEGVPGRGPVGGAAVVVLFPDESGEFVRIEGLDGAVRPGVSVSLHHQPGDLVAERLDNSASVGFVYARGETAEAALEEARRAAAGIRIRTRRTAP
ncbi:ATP-grasp domain-containing protein [Streptomyces sp. C11-1]|uniref:ATP-grasp domain-containing protein n=1 Tax=Streptomyces durocortorensis TaxID=2811104 RepID=A0ABY9W3L5_9ACTN|nr:ATP-grasp domain-containing protein [Streptomyces durocortorensis]WNF30744.1 ATP-grasp domain-containing protein [Streptomyces durocortorensis]